MSLSPPHSRIVTPTTSWPSSSEQRGGHRRVDAAAHGDEDRSRRRHPRAAGAHGGRGSRRGRWSTSASVDVAAERAAAASRSASSSARPCAASTCDGSMAPLAHDDAGRRAHAGPVEQEQQRLALHALDAQVGRARRTLAAGGTVSLHAGDGGEQPVDQPVAAARPDAGDGRRPLGHGAAAPPRPWPRCRRRCGVPLRRSRSWPPPEQRARGATPLAHDERADALGPAELVGADATRGRAGRGRAATSSHGERLHGVGVQQRAAAPARHERGHVVEGLHGADLVVGQHHRHEPHVGVERSGQRVEVDAARRRRRATMRPADVLDRVRARRGARRRVHTRRPPCRRTPPRRRGCRPRCRSR